jgi:hypothetical protein
MGFFSNLFGGKKKEAPKAEAAPVASSPAKAAAPVKSEKSAARTQVVEAAAEPVQVSGAGVAQVKLRLKLAAALRSGEFDAAYQAASGLAEIQTRAGRRVAARVWREQADRILTATGA